MEERRRQVDEIMKKVWGDEPYGFVSTQSLAEIGTYSVFSLWRVIGEEAPEAVDKITERMIAGLLACVILRPWNLGYAVNGTKQVLEYALDERTNENYARIIEDKLRGYGNMALEESLSFIQKNNKKGFKWSNISDIDA